MRSLPGVALALVTGFSGVAGADAAQAGAAAANGELRFAVRGAHFQRAVVCGRKRKAAVASVGRPVTAQVAATGPGAKLVVERCGAGHRLHLHEFPLVRRGRLLQGRLDTSVRGGYRVRATAGGARSRPAYVRVRLGNARVRKNVADLTERERRDYVAALLKLKSMPSPYDERLSYYDQFVAWHRSLSRCDPGDPLMRRMLMGHGGPMFLPWHRLFVALLEGALREASGKQLAVPYWDWTDEESTRAVFADDFMGGDGNADEGYAVTTGPFRKGRWELVVHPIGVQYASSATPYLTRRFGSIPVSYPTPEAVEHALAAPSYDVPPYNQDSDPAQSFRNALEGYVPPVSSVMTCGSDGVVSDLPNVLNGARLHNAIHAWVGGSLAPETAPKAFGTMALLPSSVNDPVFFLHHSMIDRVWAKWQQEHGIDTYRPLSGYPMNNADDVMHPFDEAGVVATPQTVADIRDFGYRYR